MEEVHEERVQLEKGGGEREKEWETEAKKKVLYLYIGKLLAG